MNCIIEKSFMLYLWGMCVAAVSSGVHAGTAISAPIFPVSLVELFKNQKENYPADKSVQLKLAQDNFKSYEYMLKQCANLTEGIVLGDNLTDAQIMRNYQLTAECGYDHFLSKPYYIPQLVADVDICREALGGDFRMISEADVRTFSPEFYRELNGVLALAGSGWSFGKFYFSTITYIRGDDGKIKIGNLQEQVGGSRVTALPTSVDPRNHLENVPGVGGPITLRCMRTD